MNAQPLTSRHCAGRRVLSITAALTVVFGLALIGLPKGASALAPSADLKLTKSDSVDPTTVGSKFTYTITVENLGPSSTSAVMVSDTLPAQVNYVSATTNPAAGSSCSRTGATVTCDLGTVAVGSTETVTITVKAKKSGTASNTATVSSTTADPVAANNQDTETTVIRKAPAKPNKTGPSCAAPTIKGTTGDDTLYGTPAADVIVSYGGDDRIYAYGGRDLICAGPGADLVRGGLKGDTVIGGIGPDRLIGEDGNDVIKGKAGRDVLRGNLGNDFLNGGRGIDNCKGGPGADTLRRCP